MVAFSGFFYDQITALSFAVFTLAVLNIHLGQSRRAKGIINFNYHIEFVDRSW